MLAARTGERREIRLGQPVVPGGQARRNCAHAVTVAATLATSHLASIRFAASKVGLSPTVLRRAANRGELLLQLTGCGQALLDLREVEIWHARRRRPGRPRVLRAIDFFGGLGLVGEGLRRAGVRPVLVVDSNPQKQFLHDARSTTPYMLAGIENRGLRFPDAEVWAASWPCTDLSIAGRMSGLRGSRSGIVWNWLDHVERDRPAALLLENVLGLIHDSACSELLQRIGGLGYYLDALVVDARHFVPQSRPRLLIVGIRHHALSELAVARDDDFSGWSDRIRQYPDLRPRRLLELLESSGAGLATVALPPLPTRTLDLAHILDRNGVVHRWWAGDRLRRQFAMIPEHHRRELLAIPGRYLTGHRRMRGGIQRLELRVDELCGCLRAAGGSARSIVARNFDGEVGLRWLTGFEAAQLQGIDEYPWKDFTDPLVAGAVGDAVCIPVIEWVARNVLLPMLKVE